MKLEKLDYKLDTLGLGVLQNLKSNEVFKDAVIAGGYIRDSILGKPFRDIDIFLPKMGTQHLIQSVKSLPSDYKFENAQMEHLGSNKNYDMNFVVFDVKYLGEIPLQIIGTNFKKEGFHQNLIDSFDYGVCQVISEGTDILGTEDFINDEKYSNATLLKLTSLEELPKAMKRFEKMKEKYPKLGFRCPLLELKNKEGPHPLRKSKLSNLEGIVTHNWSPPTPNVIWDLSPPPGQSVLIPTVQEYLNMTITDILTPDGEYN